MKISSYNITTSPCCCAPEIDKKTNPKLDKDNTKEYVYNLKINMKKAISYSCGKLIEYIIKMRKGDSDQTFWD